MMVCLESSQARWARECCKGGNCPVCNPEYESDQEDMDMDEYFEEKYG
jgi:hypothetical protein